MLLNAFPGSPSARERSYGPTSRMSTPFTAAISSRWFIALLLNCRVAPVKVKVVGKSYQEFKQHFPKPGWVEHDLAEPRFGCLPACREVIQ